MISNLKEYRADVFKCIDIIKKLKESIVINFVS